MPEAVVPDVAPRRAGARLLERAEQLGGQRLRRAAVLHGRRHDRGVQPVALGLEVRDGQGAGVLAVDVAQRLAAGAVLVALGDRLAVVGERARRGRTRAPAARRRSGRASAGACRRTARPGGPGAGRRRPGWGARGPDRRCASGGGGRWPAGPRGTSRAPTRGPSAPGELGRRALAVRRRDRRDRQPRGLRVVDDEHLDRVADELDVLGLGSALRLLERRAHVLLGGDLHQLARERDRAVELGRDEGGEAAARSLDGGHLGLDGRGRLGPGQERGRPRLQVLDRGHGPSSGSARSMRSPSAAGSRKLMR